MKIPQLTIQTTVAKLEMQNVIPKGNLEMSQKQGEVFIEATSPQIQIDTTESRVALELRNNEDFIQDVNNKAAQTVLSFIQQKNNNGEVLKQIKNKQDGFAVLALQHTEEKPVEVVIQTLPKPNISLKRGEVEITPKSMPEEAVSIQYTKSNLDMKYSPGNVKIDVKV